VNIAVLALLGYVSAEKLVQCPFGHHHEHHEHNEADGEEHHHHGHHFFHGHDHGEHKQFGIPS
jgi:hypothetical protein